MLDSIQGLFGLRMTLNLMGILSFSGKHPSPLRPSLKETLKLQTPVTFFFLLPHALNLKALSNWKVSAFSI